MTSRTLIERLAVALVSDDLRMREAACDLDKVIASGWAARQRTLGALAFWAKYALDEGKRAQFVDTLRSVAVSRARMKRRGGRKEEWHALARAVALHYLHDKCPGCQGRGYLVLTGTQHVSDKQCHVCHGTGVRPLPTAKDAGLGWDAATYDRQFGELQVLLDRAVHAYLTHVQSAHNMR